MIVLAVLMSTKSSHRVVEIMNRPIHSHLAMTPGAQNSHVVFADDLRCFTRLRVWATTGVAHRQQRQRDYRNQSNRGLQSFFVRELGAFNFAASFHTFVIFLNDPPTFVPTYHAIHIFEC